MKFHAYIENMNGYMARVIEADSLSEAKHVALRYCSAIHDNAGKTLIIKRNREIVLKYVITEEDIDKYSKKVAEDESLKDRTIRRLNEIYDNFKIDYSGHSGTLYDNEGAHIAAKNIIMDFLHELGYDDVIDKFEELADKMGFCYA